MTIGYIAGFFDGEGTISITKSRIRISIPQTNLQVLEEIQKFLGVGKIFKEKKRKEHWKDAWVYYTGNSLDTYIVLLQLNGLLIVKKDKVEEAIKTYNEYYKLKLEKEKKYEAIKYLIAEGLSYRDIEKKLGIGRQSVCRYMKNK